MYSKLFPKHLRSRCLFQACYVFLLLTLSACAPNATVYYRPAVKGGVITAGKCVPTENRAKFSLNNLQITTVANISKKEVTIVVSMNTSMVQTVHFTSDRFEVHDINKGMRIIDSSMFVSREDKVKSPSIPFPAGGINPSPLGLNFNVYISFPDTGIESFMLISPPIIINGIETEFPIIRFQRKTWVGISPLNC